MSEQVNARTLSIIQAAIHASEKLTKLETTTEITQVFEVMQKNRPSSAVLKEILKGMSGLLQQQQKESHDAYHMFAVCAQSHGISVTQNGPIRIQDLLSGNFGGS